VAAASASPREVNHAGGNVYSVTRPTTRSASTPSTTSPSRGPPAAATTSPAPSSSPSSPAWSRPTAPVTRRPPSCASCSPSPTAASACPRGHALRSGAAVTEAQVLGEWRAPRRERRATVDGVSAQNAAAWTRGSRSELGGAAGGSAAGCDACVRCLRGATVDACARSSCCG